LWTREFSQLAWGSPETRLIELSVANGRTESQFPLVPKAVLVCWYDVVGTIAIAASPLRIRRAAFL
jgi:hypothetical protein